MRAELILVLILLLAGPALAVHEAGSIGPYNISFDMNTTMKYDVVVEKHSNGITSSGMKFARYNLSIESADYFAWLILTEYNESMLASINANKDIVEAALQASGCDNPRLFQPLIDGQPGVLGNCRYESGDVVVVASYSPDGSVEDNGEYRGRTNFRIISTYPWEITRDLLYTLHVEAANK